MAFAPTAAVAAGGADDAVVVGRAGVVAGVGAVARRVLQIRREYRGTMLQDVAKADGVGLEREHRGVQLRSADRQADVLPMIGSELVWAEYWREPEPEGPGFTAAPWLL